MIPKRGNKTLERDVQRAIVKRMENDGWMVVKINLCNKPGFPDLMALRDGVIRFIEVKRPGEKPRPLQEYRMKQLREHGFDAIVIDHAPDKNENI